MDFALSPEQEAVRDSARRFAREKLAPDYQKREAAGVFDRALVREMGGLGFIASELPEEYGGMAVGSLTMGLITEELSHGDFNIGYVQVLGSLVSQILLRHGRPEHKREWLPKIASGEALVALGLTEPRGGSDAANLQLKARRHGNGYVLDGEKTSISFSDQADALVVFARTGDANAGARGVSAFVLPANEPGITRNRFNDLGTTIVGRGSIFFDNVKLPADALLGDEGKGFYQVMQGFDFSRALIGLQCLGAARASLEEAWAYAGERQAFKTPLVRFQGVSFPLAEAETHITAARWLCYRTLWLRDKGLPHTAEAAMCKWWAPQVSVNTIHQCLLTHGHAGYSRDLPHQQRLRDVIGLEIGDGTAQVMKLIIAREKAGRVAVQYA
jgi:cyclohexanecarboxyl-CoA dehydrogenase